MKRLLLALLFLPSVAFADACATNLQPLFTDAQATKLCSTFPISAVALATLRPGTDNAFDLGSASFSWRTLYLGTSRISKTSDILRVQQDAQRLFTWDGSSDTALTMTFGDAGTTAAQTFTLSASTADADDDSTVVIAGGGAIGGTRGSSIQVRGEEGSGGGDIIYSTGAADSHFFQQSGSTIATIDATGLILSVTGETVAIDSGTAATACKGTGTHNGATAVTISTTCAATGAVILHTDTSDPTGSTAAQCWVANIVNGTSFDVDCDQANDATFAWVIVKEG